MVSASSPPRYGSGRTLKKSRSSPHLPRRNWIWHSAGQMWYMQSWLRVPKARHFWRAWRALSASETAPLTVLKTRGIGSGMAETTEKTGEKKLGIGSSKTLSLKARGVEQSVVRQNFSHGRTKQVLVEKVKTRAPGKPKAEPTV